MSEQEYQARSVEEKLREALKDHSKEGYTDCLIILHNQNYVVTSVVGTDKELELALESSLVNNPQLIPLLSTAISSVLASQVRQKEDNEERQDMPPFTSSGFELQVWQQSAILSRPEFKSIQDLMLYARVHHPETYWYILQEEGQALGITEQSN